MQNNWISMLDQVAKMNEQAAAAATDLNKITTRTQGLLARKQLAALEACLETGTAQLALLGETRDPKDLMERQVQMVTSFSEKMVATAQESLNIQVQARDELARWFEDGVKSAQSNMGDKAPAPKSPAVRRVTRTSKKAA